MDNTDGLWTRCTASLREQVSDATWQMWLSPIEPLNFEGSVLTLSVPNAVVRERVSSRFLPMIQDTLATVAGGDISVELQVSERETPPSLPAPEDPPVQTGPQSRAQSRSVARNAAANRETPSVQLDPRFTFDTFVAASSNRLAHAAAQSVAEIPGRSYNPLFIYGASGLGKTHLLHAIGNYVQENYSQHRILYVTTETFLNDFVDALRMSATIAFKRRYRECDVLLIDDIQFMETRGETFHEEIFHTYNALHGEGKQIVLTSDRSPRDLAGLQERFRSRLLQGLVTEIDQPDLETRIAILRSKAELEGIDLPDDVAEWIAHRVRDNIRELEGSITMLRAFANLRQEPISLELARNHLTNLGQEQIILKPETILSVVSDFYGLSVEDVRGSKRLRPLVHARHVAMYLIRDLLDNYSYPMIARIFDGRNHTTVISGVEKIREQLAINAELLAQINQLKRRLQGDVRD